MRFVNIYFVRCTIRSYFLGSFNVDETVKSLKPICLIQDVD